jgi:hypothetical protein
MPSWPLLANGETTRFMLASEVLQAVTKLRMCFPSMKANRIMTKVDYGKNAAGSREGSPLSAFKQKMIILTLQPYQRPWRKSSMASSTA